MSWDRELRAQFPALERLVWLNTPTAPPGAAPVVAALERALGEWSTGSFDWQAWEAEGEATRASFARMIGGRAECVALVTSVAEAAATVAASLPPGRVVTGAREFRSNLFPWLALERRGFDVVCVPAVDGVVSTDALIDAIDDRTLLVAVSEVQSSNGFRIHLDALADACRRHGARLFVNLTQALGALRFDVAASGADYVVAHGYKWLLCPRGTTWLHVRPELVDEVAPLAPSWHSPENPYAEYYGGPLHDVARGARKLDASPAWLSWVGARAALDLLGALDARVVERRCVALAAAFRDGARAAGHRVAPQDAPSQTVAVRVGDPDALVGALAQRRVVGAVRGGWVRLGFHAFNDDSDVDAALAALGRA
ncbi:MAG TPA: aminotransferase class V-fold PLP-dependent enzyme [Actinomycetota bacterium]|nr:aminotransferase class V-fold PLP-dependent enzyme [Actinomycetota bacterium]